MRDRREQILDELDYLKLITDDCTIASKRIRDAAASLELGLPLLISRTDAPESKGLALQVAFEELKEAQLRLHSLIGLVEGRLLMLTAEVDA